MGLWACRAGLQPADAGLPQAFQLFGCREIEAVLNSHPAVVASARHREREEKA
jgi:hypothetical protein